MRERPTRARIVSLGWTVERHFSHQFVCVVLLIVGRGIDWAGRRGGRRHRHRLERSHLGHVFF